LFALHLAASVCRALFNECVMSFPRFSLVHSLPERRCPVRPCADAWLARWAVCIVGFSSVLLRRRKRRRGGAFPQAHALVETDTGKGHHQVIELNVAIVECNAGGATDGECAYRMFAARVSLLGVYTVQRKTCFRSRALLRRVRPALRIKLSPAEKGHFWPRNGIMPRTDSLGDSEWERTVIWKRKSKETDTGQGKR